MKKYQILKKAKSHRDRALKLLNDAVDLETQANCMPDKGQFVTEEIIKGKPVTFMNWKEKFINDDDPKDIVVVNRKRAVKIDGVNVDDFGRPVQHYH